PGARTGSAAGAIAYATDAARSDRCATLERSAGARKICRRSKDPPALERSAALESCAARKRCAARVSSRQRWRCVVLVTGMATAPRAEERIEGFGSATKGGAGGREVWVTEASVERLRDAIRDVNETGDAVLRFDVAVPIMVTRPLPYLTAPHVTIDGHGATLD